jgi:hypothetical protein
MDSSGTQGALVGQAARGQVKSRDAGLPPPTIVVPTVSIAIIRSVVAIAIIRAIVVPTVPIAIIRSVVMSVVPIPPISIIDLLHLASNVALGKR